MPERANPDLAVVTTAVLGFDDGVLEDQGSVPEIDTVLVEVPPPLFLVPFEADGLRYTFVDTSVKSPNCRRSTLLVSHEAENASAKQIRDSAPSPANQALRRWLVRFAAQPGRSAACSWPKAS